MSNRPIGVFDSGIGGLSVLSELYKYLPNENYIFFADQKNVPYGEKEKPELIALTSRIMEFMMAHDVKLVVAACNTTTCYAIEELRETFHVPIVGVVPAIKLAAERTKTGSIGLIATPATAKSEYVDGLIEKFASHIKNVSRVGCPGLADIVEAGSLDDGEVSQLLHKYILPLKEQNIDQLVLGCTHYPFLKKQIADILGPGVALIDSGEAVARRVMALLEEGDDKNISGAATTQFFTNKNADDFSRVASQMLGREAKGMLVA